MAKRQVEVFTAGCPICEPTVALVEELAGSDCEVTVHDLREHEQGVERARRYGITTVPAVVVDGRLAACCERPGPTETSCAPRVSVSPWVADSPVCHWARSGSSVRAVGSGPVGASCWVCPGEW
jgi:glutaredoxin 3